MTGAAKVDNSDGTFLGVAQQDVLWLEVTVDDVEGGVGEKEQSCAQLLRKLASQVEGDTPEISVSEQLVEVIGEELKDKAQVVAKHEVALQPD